MAQIEIPVRRRGPGELIGGYWVVLQAWTVQNIFAAALLGPEGARITAGYGEWEVVPRPRDVGITEWKGRRNYEMTIDLLFDGWLTHPVRPNIPARGWIGRPPLRGRVHALARPRPCGSRGSSPSSSVSRLGGRRCARRRRCASTGRCRTPRFGG